MNTQELKDQFDQIKGELMLLRTDVTLINYDLTQIREQLDRIENSRQQSQESIGIAPGTPPPTFIPPEYL